MCPAPRVSRRRIILGLMNWLWKEIFLKSIAGSTATPWRTASACSTTAACSPRFICEVPAAMASYPSGNTPPSTSIRQRAPKRHDFENELAAVFVSPLLWERTADNAIPVWNSNVWRTSTERTGGNLRCSTTSSPHTVRPLRPRSRRYILSGNGVSTLPSCRASYSNGYATIPAGRLSSARAVRLIFSPARYSTPSS